MKNSNMKSGICPQCGNSEIYTDSSLSKRGERTTIPITGIK
ncbi:MAG: hypothetical protein NTY74_15975 [Ignavibacteriae bacterium]|nr:hypothetical protein [Ignavibacteriota bacterium]